MDSFGSLPNLNEILVMEVIFELEERAQEVEIHREVEKRKGQKFDSELIRRILDKLVKQKLIARYERPVTTQKKTTVYILRKEGRIAVQRRPEGE